MVLSCSISCMSVHTQCASQCTLQQKTGDLGSSALFATTAGSGLYVITAPSSFPLVVMQILSDFFYFILRLKK